MTVLSINGKRLTKHESNQCDISILDECVICGAILLPLFEFKKDPNRAGCSSHFRQCLEAWREDDEPGCCVECYPVFIHDDHFLRVRNQAKLDAYDSCDFCGRIIADDEGVVPFCDEDTPFLICDECWNEDPGAKA